MMYYEANPNWLPGGRNEQSCLSSIGRVSSFGFYAILHL